MAEKKQIEILWESGTHWGLKVCPVDGHELVLMVDKKNFTIDIPFFEWMNVYSIVKLIVQLYKEDPENPVIKEFLSFLQQPENKDEELKNFEYVLKHFHS